MYSPKWLLAVVYALTDVPHVQIEQFLGWELLIKECQFGVFGIKGFTLVH